MTGPKWTPAVVLFISLCKVVVCLPPTFDPINTIQVPEDRAAGSAIGVLTVRDATSSHISLTVSPTTQQYVYIDQRISINGFYNASIVLQRKLDYETDGSSLRLVFTATNPSTPDGVRQTVTVIITDVNDNPPQFQGLPYSVSVPENHSINSIIFTANSKDPDTGIGGLVNYTMKTSRADVRSKFHVSRIGNVTLIGPLDYETLSFYQFTIVATDGAGLTSEAQLFVTVTDVQDTPPYFTGRPYLPYIWENLTVNSNVVTISAQDGDRGNPNNITYRITGGTCPGYFNINPTKGTIDLIKVADRDSGTVLQNNGICVIDVQAVEVTSSGTSGATASDTVTVTIQDKNDNSPKFNSSNYEATIQENMPTGIPITFTTQTVHVEDKDQADNAKLSLSLDSYSSTYFEIVPSTVQGSATLLIRVKDNIILDYEHRQIISLTVWANETSTPERKSASTTIQLNITNQNDNSPNFTNSEYSASVQEGSGVSTSVITVTAVDDDLEPFKTVTYALRGDDGMFSISSSGKVAVASDQLDRETKSMYYISVEATDPGGLKDTAQLTVNITDANDNPPVFRRDYDGYLKENDHSFSRPITVSATDADVGVNGQVRYSISRTYPRGLVSHFAVDGVKGDLSVPTVLDYENLNSSQVAVMVRATDSGIPQLYTDVNVTLTVQDENDKTPAFKAPSYNYSIEEGTSLGSSVITVSATDDDGTDPNDVIYYTIVSGDDGRFRINPNSGEISTSGILDYESKTAYKMVVMVQDRGSPERNSTVAVNISIINVNDESPKFNVGDKTVSVYENITTDEHVEDFSATDADPDRRLEYTVTLVTGINEEQQDVSSQVQDWFSVNKSTGEIRASRIIDRETAQQVTLSLQVNDTNASARFQPQIYTGTLVINILDVDDNNPRFNQNAYSASITENMDRGTPITFTTPDSLNVSDIDLRDNSYLSLTLSGAHAGYFTISPDTVQSSATLSIRVDNSTILDYEMRQSITLTVVASEPRGGNHLNRSCTVTLSILDANDNDPEFQNVPYSADVRENVADNTPVYTVNATDVDTGSGGNVTYTLQGDQTYFRIDTFSGQVHTRGRGLDREITDTYYLTVQATDGGGRRQTTLLTINITDANDEAPSFRRDYYDGNLIDGKDAFSRPIILKANDDDEPNTNNSRVRYSITKSPVGLQNNFSVDPDSGAMTVVGVFDYESLDASISDTLTFNVTASDLGSPVLSSSVVVNISIQDFNDFTPTFHSAIYTASVREDISQGHNITRVGATDGDRTSPNKDIFYMIESGGLGKFRIDSSSGEIVRAGELDKEKEAYYSLVVVAMDRGTPSLSSSTIVNVTVTDVNDVAPVFQPSSMSVDVNETTSTDVKFTAYDPDDDANLTYSIDWSRSSAVDGEQKSITTGKLKTVFSIDELRGDVRVRSSLDREDMELVTLVINVRDANGDSSQTATGTLIINVIDVDDNKPLFNNDTYIADIKENMATGIPISFKIPNNMTVSDKDKGENSLFELSLVGCDDFTPVPQAVRSSATVLITVKNPAILDYERRHSVNFTIMAKEQHGSGFNTTAFVQLNILDVNDNDPKFVKTEYTAEISEDKIMGTRVVNVTATDEDSAEFGMGAYTLQGGQNLFDINNATGEVTVANGTLDRERQSQYFLTVVATDKGGRRSTVQLTVNVTDYNDNAPLFIRDGYDAVLKENNAAFDKTVKVQATDLDEGLNSQIQFSLKPSTYSANFTIDPNSGDITPTAELDYERLNSSFGGLIELLVIATDKGNPALSSNVTLSIQVQDLNDNTPAFDSSSYTYNITENSNISSEVGQVLAQDGDGSAPNNEIFYLIQSGSSDKFTINSTTGDIVTSGSLDREAEAIYSLTVVAIDRGNPPRSGTTSVTVHIININDETPVFAQTSVTRSVKENQNASQVLYQVSAKDDDEDALLNYTVVWSGSEAFDDKQTSLGTSFLQGLLRVDSHTGKILLKQTLDREQVETVRLTIHVEDENAQDPSPQTATATITFIVLDENDNDPEFDNSTVHASIDENAQPGTPISFSQSLALGVSDLDKDINSVFNLSLSPYTDNFELVPVLVRSSASVLVRVTNNTILDYEKTSNISFTIIARETQTSEHRSSSAHVTLVINDVNDHDPKFGSTSYTASVAENSRIETSVILISATDADSSKFGMGTYSFQRSEEKFAINATSGEVYVTGALDRETKSEYSITVLATDLGGRTQSVALTVNITDVNDETPTFQRNDYSAVLVENTTAFIRPLQVQATDADEPNTQNSRIAYRIDSAYPNLISSFSVNSSSGLIEPIIPVDYDTLGHSTIVLVVVATDGGTKPKSSNLTVTITVEDINDNSPTFKNSSYSSSISEASGLDTPVVKVQATDADGSAPNNQVFYLIESGASDAFKINGSSGEITVAGNLDRETTSKYTLRVKAMDRGSPVLSSFVSVTIIILDVNDQNPVFSPDVQFTDVNETLLTETFYTFSATDQDMDSNLSYSISWYESSGRDDQQRVVNESYLQSVVGINSASGEVKTVGILDREKLVAITLVIVVTDTNANTTGQTATGTLSITVMDVNDNSPVFSVSTYSAEIQENMPVGTPITFTTPTDMIVSDADYETNSEFELTIAGAMAGVFTPVPNRVRSSSSVILRVLNSTWLDYEENHNFAIKLIAKETKTLSQRSSTATVSVKVLDANDNSPTFLNTSYSVTIPEDYSSSTSIVNITATDPDSDQYSMGTYTLSGSEKKFVIDNTTGEVTVVATLDRELKSQYIMTVTAEDKGGRKQTVPLTVTLSDVNDNIPKFRISEYIGNIKENQNNFSSEVRVSATDADESSSPNSHITFSLDSSNALAGNLSINGSSGVISPRGPLDYEKLLPSLSGTIVLTVIATDGGAPRLSSTATLRINVQDENDNAPVFNKTTFSGDVMESGNPGEHILQVEATDSDGTAQNSDVFYILLGEGSYKFQIDGSSGNISTAAPLDREFKAEYNLTVMAMDRGTPPRSSSATVIINVTDVNDDVPKFRQPTVSESVPETNNVGSILYTMSAIDHDQDAHLVYTIFWNDSSASDEDLNPVNRSRLQEILKVNTSTGGIVLMNDLDREEIELIKLKLHVIDTNGKQRTPQTATATLTLSVTDVDDNAPSFNDHTYTAFIEENSQHGIPITLQSPSNITVEDKDKDLNSVFSLSLMTYSDVFDVVPSVAMSTATVLIRVKNSTQLDYETIKSMTLILMANETKVSNPRNSTVTIVLNITDANDNAPVFDNSHYAGSVCENADAGHSILQVAAHDNDSAKFNVDEYRLLGTHADFAVNKTTGILTVAQANELDRETQATYSLTVEVVDKGGLRSSVDVTVNVTDFNDNPPVFNRVEYSANLREGELHFDRPLLIKTTDNDLKGTINTAVSYSIQSPSTSLNANFSINSTGVLTPKGAINFEALTDESRSGIKLLVVATDGGSPHLSSNVTVTIQVQDINDNTPQFTNEPYTASIPENATEGTSVVNVSATDNDGENPNNQVMFVIDSGGSDNFRVNGRTGAITVQTGAALDREREHSYSLVVVTIDQGTPPLSSNATVSVTITDVNDEPPFFNLTSNTASFTENRTVNCSYRFNAYDRDEDNLLNYTILWDRSHAYDERGSTVNISLVKDWFTVNATTGDLCSLPSVIDRETAESITIMVQVRDLNAEEHIDTQTATVSVPVTIKDMNDNYPHIVQGSNIAVNVSEGTPVGTVIITLDATDRDQRQTVTFSTKSTKFNITQEGRISLVRQLDRESASTVNFTILATDDGSPPLTSTSTINIVVLDTNDNDPEFNMSVFTFNVSEGSPNGTVVATVTATDKDAGNNAYVTYLLADDKGGLFRMDSISGEIILEELLDREYVSTYSLTVTARDNPIFETPRLKRKTITIDVTDVNDNSPQFATDYQQRITEKTKQGGTILTVHANDEDIGDNGKVWYSLQDETVNATALFAIDANTGAITAAEDLLGLADNYSLIVVATDEGTGNLTGNATVTVTVLDENLNSPVFVNVTDIPPIPECSRMNSNIFRFYATDADKDKNNNGKVEFNMTDTSDVTTQHFNLDKVTGSLTIIKKLNSETQSKFTFKVMAYDLGLPSLSTISRLYTINLKDVNDNPPVFNQSDTSQKHFSVSENVINTSLGPIRAVDPDKDSQICYAISDTIYTVNLKQRISSDNRTLYLDVIQPFDRENVTEFTVKVTATDCSPAYYNKLCDNSTLSLPTYETSTLVTITVLDKNDNPPVYRQPVLSKGIRNTVTLGRIIFNLDTLVYDRDSPKFSRHSFYRVNSTEADTSLLQTGYNSEKHPIPISVTGNGTVATNMSFSAVMYGFFIMKVAVSDSAGMDVADLKIFIIADFQVLKITFMQSIDDVLKIQDNVLSDMSNATGYTFLTNDDVASHLDQDGNVQPYHSDMFVHAVDPATGEILDAENTRRIIDRNQGLGYKLINKYKVTQVGEADATVAKQDYSERRMYILIAIICLLGFTLLLLIYISCNRIQRYKWKLKAATIDVKGPIHEEREESGFVNINPLFNKEIALHQEMETQSIASGDSLDNNQVLYDGRAKEDDEQEITVNFFDEKQQIRYSNNALGEVLRQYDFIDEEMGTRGHDLGDSASSSSEQGESNTQGKLVVGRRQNFGDLDDLESTEI
ncbi:cadherin-23-like [Haliotis cracherodii]|uniref:cadherin-23-like n=1 Tax=Haliotis cracherodii TaxID=6455 RepID=UPI0039ECC738